MKTRHTHRLRLEALEDRSTPTIVFDTAPALTVSDDDGPVLSDARIELVFWGADWTTPENSAFADQIEAALNLVNGSGYFDGLSQYRGSLPGSPRRFGRVFITDSSPPVFFTDANVRSMLESKVEDGTIPVTPDRVPNLLYMVVPQPGSSDPTEGLGGEHSFISRSIFEDDLHYGWTINDGELDTVMNFMSHELVEAISDPEGTAIQINPRNDTSWNEISDGRAQGFAYRLGNALVQSYFSRRHHAFIVPDGQDREFFLSREGQLRLVGDQTGFNAPDTIRVRRMSDGKIEAQLSGAHAVFDAGVITSIEIWGRGGADSIFVDSMDMGVPVSIFGESGGDRIFLADSGHDLNAVNGSIVVNGGDGGDFLTLSDSAHPLDERYTITRDSISRGSFTHFFYTGMEHVTLQGAAGTNRFDVQTLSAETTILGGPRTDVVDVTRGNLGGVGGGPLIVVGNTGTDFVYLRDQASIYRGSYRYTALTFTRLGFAGLTHSEDVEQVVLNAARGDNTINIDDTRRGVNLIVSAGAGIDRINVGTGNLDRLTGRVQVTGGTERDTVHLFDDASPAGNFYAVTDRDVRRQIFGGLSYDPSIETLLVDAGNFNDSFAVQSTSVTTYLNGGQGPDTFNVYSQANSLEGIRGSLTLNGGIGTDQAHLMDLMAIGQGYQLARTTFWRPGILAVGFNGLEDLAIDLGPGGDRVALAAPVITVNTTIDGGEGADTFLGASAGNTWNLTGLDEGIIGAVHFHDFQNLRGGGAADNFVFAAGGRISGSIEGGTDAGDSLNYSTDGGMPITANLDRHSATLIRDGLDDGFSGIEGLVGSSASDVLIGASAANDWVVTTPNEGRVGGFWFASVESLFGGTDVDSFRFLTAGRLSRDLDGGGTPAGKGDWLDYGSFAAPVVVELPADSATGVSGKVRGIQNVIGSRTRANRLLGNVVGNILVGGTAADEIIGGTGKSLLIGGANPAVSPDRVFGGADDDIVIGTFTAHDRNKDALMAMLAEWQSDTFYLDRIRHLQGTLAGGLNGSFFLQATTVSDDGIRDNLKGGLGTDWFWAYRTDTFVELREMGEVVSPP